MLFKLTNRQNKRTSNPLRRHKPHNNIVLIPLNRVFIPDYCARVALSSLIWRVEKESHFQPCYQGGDEKSLTVVRDPVVENFATGGAEL
jgi:hypothetical protein